MSEYEIQQKLGRNVLLFQRMEAMLKFLLSHSNLAGYAHELETRRREKISAHDRQTMGMLVKQFSRKVLSPSEGAETEPEELTGVWFSFEFRMEHDTLEESLTAIVEERNNLIHQFVLETDWTSPEGLRAAIAYLDQQHEKARPTYLKLKDTLRMFQETAEETAAYFATDHFRKYLDLQRGSGRRVMELLDAAARENVRPDGLTDLSTAGQILRKEAPEELAALKAAYGQSTLKGLLIAADVFEIYEESLPGGGVRVLYRLKTVHTG